MPNQSRFCGDSTPFLALGLIAFVVVGCTTETRLQAQRIVKISAKIDPALPAAMRQPHIDALGKLPLSDKMLKRVRDMCVKAHRALVVAELEHDRAMASFKSAELDSGSESKFTAEKIAALEKMLSKSNRSLASAQKLLPACQSRLRDLRLKHES